MDNKIFLKMIELGFHSSSKGFNYLVDATKLFKDNPKIRLEDIYEILSVKSGCTPDSIERCIRGEIERFYKGVPLSSLHPILTPDKSTGKLKNKEMLSRLSKIFEDLDLVS